jgi:Flp pilus assembly protein TadD
MHTHTRAALAVCLLAVVSAGCQSARMPSLAFWNRSPGDAAIASAAAAANERHRSEPAPGDRIQQVSYNRAGTESQRREDIADALGQARSADARGQVEAARAHYQRVLDLEPGHADALHALGILADKHGDYRTAETHYFRALRAKADDANLLSDMGYSYFLQGRRHDAEYYLREALKYDPQHAKARGNLDLLFNEQQAFETYRQLLGDREATARMHALFPQAGSRVARTAAAAAAPPAYGYEDQSRSVRSASPAVQTYSSQAGSAAWPQQDPRTAYRQTDRSTVDYLRGEMERERFQAASQREQQHETTIAPAVAAEAFGQSHSGFGPPQSPASAGFDTRQRAAFGQPQQFAGTPPQASGSPYGQWVEPPRANGAVATQAPTSGGAGVEQWPHAPGSAWGTPASQGHPAHARPTRTAAGNQSFDHMQYPTTSATSAAPQSFARQASPDTATMSDVNRAAQRIGMEGGLFPSDHPSMAATQSSRQPAAHGVAPVGAVSTSDGWNGGLPNWNGQAGIRTAEAWQGQSSPYGASSDPRYPQRPGIVITPGASGTAAPASSASARPAEHGWNAGPEAPANGYAPEAQGAWSQGSPAAGSQPWPQSGYGAPAAAHPGSARAGDIPSYWQNAPGGTGWNGQ